MLGRIEHISTAAASASGTSQVVAAVMHDDHDAHAPEYFCAHSRVVYSVGPDAAEAQAWDEHGNDHRLHVEYVLPPRDVPLVNA